MKRTLYFAFLALIFLCHSLNAQLGMTISGPMACPGTQYTHTVTVSSSPTNAASFTWSATAASCTGAVNNLAVNGSTAAVNYPCCGTFTITCYAFDGGNSLIATTSMTDYVSCAPSPTITTSANNGTMCAGSLTLSATGGVSYTWIPGNLTGSGYVISHTATTCYSVIASNGTCTAMASKCVTVVPATSISVAATSTHICLGQSTTLTASGASAYTWTPIGLSGSMIVVTPTTSYNYIVQDLSGAACPGSVSKIVLVSPNPTISASASSSTVQCGNASTLTVTGSGHTYTWTTGTTNSLIVVSPTASTCYSVVTTNTITPAACTAATVVCINVTPAPLTVVGSNTTCNGVAKTLSVTSPGSYTWAPGSGTLFGQSVSVTPSVTTQYTVTGNLTNGCAVTNTHVLTVIQHAAISVSGNSAVCAGQSTTLTASGGSSYSWSPGGITTNPAVLTPTTSTLYTVTETGVACPGSTTTIVLVNPSPTVTAFTMPGATISCGSSVSISAAGAQSYSWSTGQTAPTIIVSPTASTCYTAVGTLVNGCSNSLQVCVTVDPAQVTVSGNNTVCLGSSANLAATPNGSYNWNPGTLTGTAVNVLPLSTTVYTANGTFTNGCSGGATFAVQTLTSCAIVWPGDANSDGVVNSNDVFEIGLAFNATGAARSPTSNAWSGQFASVWTGTVSTGKNLCHADCNGDGTINNADTLAITNNFSGTHTFRQSQSAGSDIRIVSETGKVYPGWNKLNVVAGDASAPLSKVYGLAFELSFNGLMIEGDGAHVSYPASFLNTGAQNVEFRKVIVSNGKIYVVSVRTNGQDVSGEGVIAELWLKLKDDIGEGASVPVAVSNAIMIDHSGVQASLSSTATTFNLTHDAVGLKESSIYRQPLIYPQPASGKLQIEVYWPGAVHYTITDLVGKCFQTGSFSVQTTIDVLALAPGTYIISFQSGHGTANRKIITAE
jgi:hypothetical protein